MKAYDEDGFARKNIGILGAAYEDQVPLLEGFVNCANAISDGRIKEDIFSKDEMQLFYLVLYHALTNVDKDSKVSKKR